MGRSVFSRFIDQPETARHGETGVRWGGASASWDELLVRGRALGSGVRPQRTYLVDPRAGLDALVAFFAVATVPDTVCFWATPECGAQISPLAPALYEVCNACIPEIERPLWGVMTSGSSGTPKMPVGYGDMLEAVAMQYDMGVIRPTFGADEPPCAIATCLPLQFSAAFFMTVAPALFLRRDLVIFDPHDWRPLCELAQTRNVLCLSVPAVVAAGYLSIPEPIDMSRAALLLGAGYVTRDRVASIREKFIGAKIMNIYGTAETGAISVDREPGHNRHVGRPIPGKPVWIRDRNDEGIGVIATTGADCRSFSWTPDGGLVREEPVVASTDYGHFDADGCLVLDGRCDAGEKLHGITIFPRETERHILDLPGVIDVRVGVSIGSGGREALEALVVGTASVDNVREHCRELVELQRPAVFRCVSEDEAQRIYSVHGKLRVGGGQRL